MVPEKHEHFRRERHHDRSGYPREGHRSEKGADSGGGRREAGEKGQGEDEHFEQVGPSPVTQASGLSRSEEGETGARYLSGPCPGQRENRRAARDGS
jgi:hypothetical protein